MSESRGSERWLPLGQAIRRRLPRFSQSNQVPLADLEIQLTQDFNNNLGVSLDSYPKLAAVTVTDGPSNDNQQAWTALGATVGGSPWSRAQLALTGGGVVAGNPNSPNGWLVRLQFQQTW